MSDISDPLPYITIKDLHNSSAGMNINPFFGKWTTTSTCPPLHSYRWILDTINNIRYERPLITENHTTFNAPYFIIPTGTRIISPDISSYTQSVVYTHADTQAGPILIVSSPTIATSTTDLAAASYSVFMDINTAGKPALTPDDKQIHWVWFRKIGYKLTTEILERAASWIACNPGFQFHLWTNLADASEYEDFMSDIPAILKSLYLPHIQVHYNSEFYTVIRDWIYAHCSEETQSVFEIIWNSSERQNIIMKTDYSRNILLATFGGIYADFNDLVCLAPVSPFIQNHTDSFVGVTDVTTDYHASNYFLYSSKNNATWQTIVSRCTDTLPTVFSLIYDAESLTATRAMIRELVIHGTPPDPEKIQHQLERIDFPQCKYSHYIFAILLAISLTVNKDTSLYQQLTPGLLRYSPKTMNRLLDLIKDCPTEIKTQLLEILETEEFAAAWRYARTDMYMSWIMYHSNLPIYCRQMKIPITLVPFGYLLRYSCILSFVGHLGDGTSYGRPASQKTTMRRLLMLA